MLFARGDPLLAIGMPETARRGPWFRFRVSMNGNDRALHGSGSFLHAPSASRNAANASLRRTGGPLPGIPIAPRGLAEPADPSEASRFTCTIAWIACDDIRSALTVSSIAYDASRSPCIVPRIACHHPTPACSASSIADGEEPDAAGETPSAASVVRIACDETGEPDRVIGKG
ncbi:MAG TPA: hypothetical protein VF756_27745 [Thermoanaerobaculia bacterium]